MQTVGDVAETPASNGGRGLKQVDKQATFNTFSETPASNGGRGLKRKPAHTPHARQLETPASNGGRGLKPHGAERGDHCQPRNARQQWRARIETGCAALARTPRLRNARQQWRARIETLFVNRLAHRHDETPASNGGRGLKLTMIWKQCDDPPRNARQQWRARIETRASVVPRSPRRSKRPPAMAGAD